MDLMTVDIRVGEVLKDYVVAIYGSDLLTPKKDSVLWAMVKLHLATSLDYTVIKNRAEYVRVSLLPTVRARTLDMDSGKPVLVNTFYRYTLSATGENTIRLHLSKEFKKMFHSYMLGAIDGNPGLSYSEAIDMFYSKFNLAQTRATFDMLKKAWYRFRQKKEQNQLLFF